MASIPVQLRNVLLELTKEELKDFVWYLTTENALEGIPHIPVSQLEDVVARKVVEKMVQRHTAPRAVDITVQILMQIDRNDLTARIKPVQLPDDQTSPPAQTSTSAVSSKPSHVRSSVGALETLSSNPSHRRELDHPGDTEMKLESPELLADPVSAEMMRECVENLGPYSQTLANAGRTIVNHVISNCTSATVRSWLQQERNNVLFLNYVRYMNVQFKSYQAEMEKKLHYGLIHIVFVAHGKITGKPVPACCLLPLNSIDHVVLYSPWNCSIDAKAAAGIALGTIAPDKRVFSNRNVKIHISIPENWNFIRQAGETLVPEIIVSPVTSNEPVWQIFSEIKNSGFWHENRLLIPYVVQEENSYLSPEIPLHLLLLALSCALPVSVNIRFHLAACLNRMEDVTNPQMLQQYAWTPDRTVMSANLDQKIQNPRLFEAFESMFGVIN